MRYSTYNNKSDERKRYNPLKKLSAYIVIMGFVFATVFSSAIILTGEKSYARPPAVVHEYNATIDLMENGDAIFNVKWDATATEGTEFYIPMGDMSGSFVLDFTVSQKGKQYKSLTKWDTSMSDKKGKCGINTNDGQEEICWGIASRDREVYYLKYRITDFVRRTSDGYPLIFWKIINDSMNIPFEKVNIKLKPYKAMDKQDLRIWGFGFEGMTKINNDGTIEAYNKSELESDNYVTLLAVYPKSAFGKLEQVLSSKDEIIKKAKKGSSYLGDKEDAPTWLVLLRTILPIAIIFFIFKAIRKSNKNGGHRKLSARELGFKSKELKGQYYREAPYKGEISDIYPLLFQVADSKPDDIISAYFLKWIKTGIIRVSKTEKGLFKNKEIALLHLDESAAQNLDGPELKLFKMVLSASGSNKILEDKEFKVWSKRNYERVVGWSDRLYSKPIDLMRRDGLIEVKPPGLFDKDRRFKLLPPGIELSKNIVKFKNYLEDFSLLEERDSYNVNIWDELMIWAAAMGITEKVYKEFKELYPDYIQETDLDYSTVVYTRTLSNTFLYTAANANVQARMKAASEGLGGGTSIGGGGGSFGGGSGGGVR